MRRRESAGPLLAALLGAQACAAPAPVATVAARDSAGVHIVESSAPSRTGEATLGPATLTVGRGEPGLNHVAGALRLTDGRIVVADDGDGLLRLFSADGDLLAETGGQGDGPGEFQSLQAVGSLTGDTVWAYDFSHARVSVFAPDLTRLRTISLEPRLPSGLAVGVLTGDTILVGESWSASRVAERQEIGLFRSPVAYARYAGDGTLIDTVGTFPGREVLISQEDGRGVMGAAPLGRTAVHALAPGGLLVSDQVGYEIRELTLSGRLTALVRWDGPDLAVTRGVRDRWRSAQLDAASPSERDALSRRLDQVELPPERPSHGAIVAADDGGFWVARYQVGAVEPARWDTFDANGEWTATVRVPEGFTPLEVGDVWVLGKTRDALDVEVVELRAIAW